MIILVISHLIPLIRAAVINQSKYDIFRVRGENSRFITASHDDILHLNTYAGSCLHPNESRRSVLAVIEVGPPAQGHLFTHFYYTSCDINIEAMLNETRELASVRSNLFDDTQPLRRKRILAYYTQPYPVNLITLVPRKVVPG